MDIPRYRKLLEEWAEYPPVHVSVAAFVYGKRSSSGAGSAAIAEPLRQDQTPGAILDGLTGLDDVQPEELLPEPLAETPSGPSAAGIVLDALVSDAEPEGS